MLHICSRGVDHEIARQSESTEISSPIALVHPEVDDQMCTVLVVSGSPVTPVRGSSRRSGLPIRLLTLIAFAGAGLGYLTALVWPAPHGAGHSCPLGSPISSCYYPGDWFRHQILLSFVGAVAALLISATFLSFRRDRRARRPDPLT